MKRKIYLTQAKLDDLREELEALHAERSSAIEQVRTAREFGDPSENSEYMSARQSQESIESRIARLEDIMQNAGIIPLDQAKAVVAIGSTVTITNDKGLTQTVEVVDTIEAEPLRGKISDVSPLGQCLLGKAEGNIVVMRTPTGNTTYTITQVA